KMDKPNKEFSVSTVREKAKDMLDRKYLKLFADKPDLIREKRYLRSYGDAAPAPALFCIPPGCFSLV
ncbi:MAG: hypothetical protein II516_03885, partial [Treponema sp.]|nr:hypothetical protein [Treponema sp.]